MKSFLQSLCVGLLLVCMPMQAVDPQSGSSLKDRAYKIAAVLVGAALTSGMLYAAYSLFFKQKPSGVTTPATTSDPARANNAQAINAPIIKDLQWGKITVTHNGVTRIFDGNTKDVKLWPGTVKAWDWTETKMHHNPGIPTAALDEFIDEVDEVILTRGMDLVLQVPQTTIEYAKNKGKTVHVGNTQEMWRLYNKLVGEGKRVGGLFHSTC